MSDDKFPMNYLAVMETLQALNERLGLIGMAGNVEFDRLARAIIRHGAETFEDINRRRPHPASEADT